MRRNTRFLLIPLAVAVLFAIPAPLSACTFCAGGLTSRLTLREHFHDSKIVVQGKLKNPRFDPSGVGGTTELHLEHTLKTDPALGNGGILVLPRYLPVIGDTPADFLVFGSFVNGKFDPVHGTPASAGVAEYLKAAAKLPQDDPVRRLTFYFGYLDAADPAVSSDAFLEFAKAPDTEILKAKAALAPTKLRKLLQDPNTPADRLGVFALMLGLCGEPTDAKLFADWIGGPSPIPERFASNLGGLLAGYSLLDSKLGWLATEAILADGKRPFNERLAAIGTLRFFQATRPESKPAVLSCYRSIIQQGELADLAIDDLRRWKWWDLTTEILAKYEGNPPPPAVVRRGVIRYALTCPGDDTKRFLVVARGKEPKIVEDIEETLRLFGDK